MVHDASMVREHIDRFNRIDSDIRKMREDIATLAVHVEQNTQILHGNGQPGLVASVVQFHAAYFEREDAKDRALAELEKHRAERRKNVKWFVGIVLTIVIALCGWAWANVFKPILDDIYRNHPAAKVVEKSSAENPYAAYNPSQDVKLPNLR